MMEEEKKEEQKKIKDIRPEDAVSLILKTKNLALGKKKPDGFTRLIFSISLFIWVLLAFWNAICYFVLISADVIDQNKSFSVLQILIKNGQQLGFKGADFVYLVKDFYFYNNFVWLLVFLGLILMYRKIKWYSYIALGGLIIHFVYMISILGVRYFMNDVSFFDKILYVILIALLLVHSYLLRKEKDTVELDSVPTE